MSNVEGQLGRRRPFGRPVFQQFDERSAAGTPGRSNGESRGGDQPGKVGNPFHAFINRLVPSGERTQREESGLQLAHPFDPFYLMHKVKLRSEGFQVDDVGFEPTEEQAQMIEHVKLAYGIIAHPFCEIETSSGKPSHIYQKQIEYEIALSRVYEGKIKVVLTQEERAILVRIARAAGILCDPEREEYFYDEIPHMILEEEGFIKPKVVDSGK
ncbi:MAG: hypothetical protein ACXWPP_05505 [Ktedonobacteraceae bacterium]